MEILLDEEGRTWVERPTAEGWRMYDVYDARGQLIGELRTRATDRTSLKRPEGPAPGRDDRAAIR